MHKNYLFIIFKPTFSTFYSAFNFFHVTTFFFAYCSYSLKKFFWLCFLDYFVKAFKRNLKLFHCECSPEINCFINIFWEFIWKRNPEMLFNHRVFSETIFIIPHHSVCNKFIAFFFIHTNAPPSIRLYLLSWNIVPFLFEIFPSISVVTPIVIPLYSEKNVMSN